MLDLKYLDQLPHPKFVIKGKNNKIFVYHNVCPHLGLKLVKKEDKGQCDVLSCPYHCWAFNQDGKT